METLRIATAPSLAYTPQFVADNLGFFADEALAVEFIYGPPSAKLAGQVGMGHADLVLGSLWFAAASTGRDLIPRIQLNAQCRYFVFAREPAAKQAFRWSDLAGRRVLIGMAAPTPWVALREILHRGNVPLDRVLVTPGFGCSEAVAEFTAGTGDYLISDGEVAVDDRLTAVAAFADQLGPVPWSVYSASAQRSALLDDRIARFSRALVRAQAWVYDAGISDVSGALDATFAHLSPEARIRIIERYRGIRLWARTTELDRQAGDRWMAMLWRWGLIDQARTLADLTNAR